MTKNFDDLVEQVLQEASQESIQLNEGVVELLSPGAVDSVVEFIRFLFKEQALVAMGLLAGRHALKFLAAILVVLKGRKLHPVIQQTLDSRRGEQLRKLKAMYEKDPEVMEVIRILNTAKTDKSKAGIAARKEATKKLTNIVKDSRVFADAERQGREQGFHALKRLGASPDKK